MNKIIRALSKIIVVVLAIRYICSWNSTYFFTFHKYFSLHYDSFKKKGFPKHD